MHHAVNHSLDERGCFTKKKSGRSQVRTIPKAQKRKILEKRSGFFEMKNSHESVLTPKGCLSGSENASGVRT